MKTSLALAFLLSAALPVMADVDLVVPAAPAEGAQEKEPGFLGVGVVNADVAVLKKHGLEKGVALNAITEGSPAEKAGLKEGDILAAVEGKAVGTMMELRDAITAHDAGDEVTLKLIQNGAVVELEVTLAARPAFAQNMGIQILPMGGNGAQNLQLQFNNLQLNGQGGFQLGLGVNGGALQLHDQEGMVELKRTGESTEVKVRNHAGEIEYEGPWDTPQDKAAVSPLMKRRIESAQRMLGVGGADFAPRIHRMPRVVPERLPKPEREPEREPDE